MDREEWKRTDPQGGQSEQNGRNEQNEQYSRNEQNGRNEQDGQNRQNAWSGQNGQNIQNDWNAQSRQSEQSEYYTVYSRPSEINAAESREAEVDYSSAAGTKEEVRSPYAWNSESSRPDYGTAAAGTGYESGSAEARSDFYGSGAGSDGVAQGAGFGGGNIPPDSPGTGAGIPKKQRKPLGSGAKKAIAAVLTIVIAFAAGLGGGAAAVSIFGRDGQTATNNISIDSSESELDAASVIAEKTMPSVVGISTVSQTYVPSIFGLQEGTTEGSGTGFIVDENGYILTNSHVVGDGENSEITVDLYDGSEYTGTVLWNDSSLDLAIVKIDATGLQAVDIGDSDEVSIGDYAIAIGNPLGRDFERSVTQGIISGLDRSITTTDGETTNNMQGLIQTDASINSGNSGGPLINSSGEVIGINTAKASSAEGLGFAIPINTAVPIIEQIKTNGTYVQPVIGIAGRDLEEIMAYYETDFNATSGVLVAQVYTDSPASEAGIKEGDIITAIDGEEVEDMNALKQVLIGHQPGDQVTLTIERNKTQMQVQVTLQSQDTVTTMSYDYNSSGSGSGSDSYGSDGSQSYGDLFGGIYGY